MTVAPSGTAAPAPIAVILPPLKTIVQLLQGGAVTGTTIAFRIATAGFLPLLLRITDCAESCSAATSEKQSAICLTMARLLLLVVVSTLLPLLVLRFLVRF